MIYSLTQSGLLDAIKALKIKSEDTLLIHSDIRSLGIPENIPLDNLLPFYKNIFLDSVNTIAVPSYFYEYARYNTPFDVATSPPSLSLGSFSRYVTSLPNRVRSCNPLQSIAAIGGQAEYLCGGDSLCGYGSSSPWNKLRLAKGKILFFGVNLQSMTYVHYIEQQWGVPHLYNKIYDVPVFRNGVRIPGNPISSVRYLDYDIEYNLAPFQNFLATEGLLQSVQCGRGTLFCVEAQATFDAGKHFLDKNPFAFLVQPPKFIAGKIPFDGATGPYVQTC